jgi:hypothetical protein
MEGWDLGFQHSLGWAQLLGLPCAERFGSTGFSYPTSIFPCWGNKSSISLPRATLYHPSPCGSCAPHSSLLHLCSSHPIQRYMTKGCRQKSSMCCLASGTVPLCYSPALKDHPWPLQDPGLLHPWPQKSKWSPANTPSCKDHLNTSTCEKDRWFSASVSLMNKQRGIAAQKKGENKKLQLSSNHIYGSLVFKGRNKHNVIYSNQATVDNLDF